MTPGQVMFEGLNQEDSWDNLDADWKVRYERVAKAVIAQANASGNLDALMEKHDIHQVVDQCRALNANFDGMSETMTLVEELYENFK